MEGGSHVQSSGGRFGLSLEEPLIDVKRAAELLNVRVSWIREATRTGYLPCLKIGKHVRYTRSMLESWLAEQRAGGPRELKRRSA
jgi:excisionase family DNA binding protein